MLESKSDSIYTSGAFTVTDIVLTPSLTQHYTELAKAKGKSVGMLVNADLTALHKKRVVREDKRVWKEIEFERL
jgi:hypothetical protein